MLNTCKNFFPGFFFFVLFVNTGAVTNTNNGGPPLEQSEKFIWIYSISIHFYELFGLEFLLDFCWMDESIQMQHKYSNETKEEFYYFRQQANGLSK